MLFSSRKTLYRIFVPLSLICYFGSLALPALTFKQFGYYTTSPYHLWYGRDCLLSTPLGLLAGHIELFANVFYFVAIYLICFQKHIFVLIFSTLALLISLEPIATLDAQLPTGCLICVDSPHNYQKIVQMHIGYYTWIFSILLIFAASFIPLREETAKKESPEHSSDYAEANTSSTSSEES